jgi:hypothetical protein
MEIGKQQYQAYKTLKDLSRAMTWFSNKIEQFIIEIH